jgi:FlaG/FlaF family flagellin (archaellin)
MSRGTTIVVLTLVGAVIAVGAITVGLSTVAKPRTAPAVASAVPATPENAGDVKFNDGGSVQVQVTLDRKATTNGSVVLQVSLNTHSVELGQYDLAKLSHLTLEPGGPLTEATWKPDANSGHHVGGTLTFSDPGGLYAKAKELTLEIRDLAGVPARTLQWQVAGQ